ncbi:MAG TPA: hypothetical protein VJT50_00240, partial [Pyrinomonadaceae bacterium]|nr:hypothetical protein [Pyrinomonadaceae bacterium]
YLEGAGEVMLVGGGDPSIPNLVPSDIEIRRNYFRKRKEWVGRATVKGTLELKNARRVLIEGNLIESDILTTAIVLTVRNQGGNAPWSTIEDVVVTNNIVRHASTGVNILGSDNEHQSETAKRIRIENNLFVDLVPNEPNNIPYFVQTNGAEQIKVVHNTVQQEGNVLTGYGAPTHGFVFRDNIVQLNRYGVVCQISGMQCGDTNPFCNCYPDGVFRGNVFADNLSTAADQRFEDRYPSGNYFVASYQRVGFVDFARGNWRLSAESRTRNRASDGSDPGLNVDLLVNAGAVAARNGNRVTR